MKNKYICLRCKKKVDEIGAFGKCNKCFWIVNNENVKRILIQELKLKEKK
jgi:hypothetical protein